MISITIVSDGREGGMLADCVMINVPVARFYRRGRSSASLVAELYSSQQMQAARAYTLLFSVMWPNAPLFGFDTVTAVVFQ